MKKVIKETRKIRYLLPKKVLYKEGNINNDGTDEYGFAVLPAGYWKSDSFYSLGSHARFWTATEHSSDVAYYLYSVTGTALVYSNNCYKTDEALPVRLVKD